MSNDNWWWRWWGGGSPVDPVQALLDEAAVRFPFAVYDDMDDMVDVNGGYGPLLLNGLNYVAELTETGLHVTTTTDPPDFTDFALRTIAPVESPIVFGPDGLTVMMIADSAAEYGPLAFFLIRPAIYCDDDNDSSPSLDVQWFQGFNTYSAFVTDNPPDDDRIVNANNVPVDPVSSTVGRFMGVYRVDVDGTALLLRLIGPSVDFAAVEPMTGVPLFATTPGTVNAVYFTTNSPDGTYVEWLAWNRVLTDAEMDALVTHFQT